MERKTEYIKVELLYNEVSQGSYIEFPDNIPCIIEQELDSLSEGDSFKLTKVFLTDKEFNDLPEFEGF